MFSTKIDRKELLVTTAARLASSGKRRCSACNQLELFS